MHVPYGNTGTANYISCPFQGLGQNPQPELLHPLSGQLQNPLLRKRSFDSQREAAPIESYQVTICYQQYCCYENGLLIPSAKPRSHRELGHKNPLPAALLLREWSFGAQRKAALPQRLLEARHDLGHGGSGVGSKQRPHDDATLLVENVEVAGRIALREGRGMQGGI